MIRRNKRILSLTLSMAVFTTMFMSTSFITKAETVSLGANSEITSNASTESAAVATNIALNKPATSSSVTGGNTASLAVDGNAGTRWESAQGSDPQWISIDLGGSYNISGVKLNWETAAAKDYKIQVSTDNKNWIDAYTKTGGTGGVENITFNSTATGRYIRMLGTARTTQYGYSLWEFEVYGTPDGNTVNNVDLGPNVKIFDPSMPSSDIQNTVDSVFSKMETNQFGNERYAFLFKPGSYNVNVNVGFFTSVLGLGKTPDAVNITGAVRCEADWMGGNATCNFWRSVENVAVTPTYSSNNLAPAGTLTWAVSQAAPMRRVHIKGGLSLWDPLGTNYDGAWSSGGFIADSKIDNSITSGSQQQFFTRNSQMGSWNGANWNMVFVGNNGAPTDDNAYPSTPDTVVSQTPAVREKPFLYIDDSGNYQVFVPDLRKNSQGVTWANGLGQGTSLSIDQFYIAKPDTSTAESINAALSQGKNIIFTPGVYHLSDAINVTKSNTVILGLGLATLIPDNGTAAMNISDVDGVKVSGILFDAGAKNSPVLLKVGQDGSSADHSANPTSLSDLFFRIGGAAVGNADTSLKINSNNVIGDDFWVWRADHGTGVGWTVNNAKNGVIVNGNNVTLYGLFVEHFKEYQTIWNGNGGKVYFYQSELPYDVPNQASWMSNNGTQNGYASYKVADSVTSHQLFGSGIYSYFRDAVVSENNGIEVPNTSGVKVHHACSVFLSGNGEITHVVNNTGNTAKSGNMKQSVTDYPNS